MTSDLHRRDLLKQALALLPLLHPAVTSAWPASRQASPAAQQPVAFHRLRMRTRRLGEMKRFYTEQLSLSMISDRADSAVFRAGRTELEFIHIPDGPDPVYHFAFNIPENKLDVAQLWLAPRCPIVRRPDGGTVYNFSHWNAHAFYFLDPSGNILEFIARHNLKNAASGAFSVQDILYASEIGLVVPDVLQTVESLKSRLGLPVYVGSSDVFAPVGDEHGLFIIVKTGRIWLGSHLAAAPFPAEIRMRGDSSHNISLPDGPFRVELIG